MFICKGHQFKYMRNAALSAFVFLLLFISGANAVGTNGQYCIDNQTLNHTYSIISNGVETAGWFPQNCTCVNNACAGSDSSSDTSQIWMVYGTGVVLLVLAIVLGMPIGHQYEEYKKQFNTTIVVKYLFFFIGLFLVYLSMGMMKRLGMTYGGDQNITNSTTTTTMVMMWTIIIFLFIFMLEFIASIITWINERALKKDRESRGEE
jgi:hypothetical protein